MTLLILLTEHFYGKTLKRMFVIFAPVSCHLTFHENVNTINLFTNNWWKWTKRQHLMISGKSSLTTGTFWTLTSWSILWINLTLITSSRKWIPMSTIFSPFERPPGCVTLYIAGQCREKLLQRQNSESLLPRWNMTGTTVLWKTLRHYRESSLESSSYLSLPSCWSRSKRVVFW